MAAKQRANTEFSRELGLIFAKCFRAYLECNEQVQGVIREMAEIVNSPEADEQEREMALGTLAEALFPEYDGGHLGIDLEEANKACVENSPDGKEAQQELDRQEQAFADRLKTAMQQKGMTQAQLAGRAGVQQPAISMMLNRNCRPQQRTVRKLAEALGVTPQELWS
jgi:lambda repressor-like predicted transcriptional regulator